MCSYQYFQLHFSTTVFILVLFLPIIVPPFLISENLFLIYSLMMRILPACNPSSTISTASVSSYTGAIVSSAHAPTPPLPPQHTPAHLLPQVNLHFVEDTMKIVEKTARDLEYYIYLVDKATVGFESTGCNFERSSTVGKMLSNIVAYYTEIVCERKNQSI